MNRDSEAVKRAEFNTISLKDVILTICITMVPWRNVFNPGNQILTIIYCAIFFKCVLRFYIEACALN